MRILLVLIFLQAFLFSNAQTGMGRIKGTVTSQADGGTLPGAVIGIKDSAIYVASDDNGQFTFNNVHPGKYSLITKYVGFKNDTVENIIVKADMIVSVNIQLKEIIYSTPPFMGMPPFNKKTAVVVGAAQTSLVAGSLIGLYQLWYKQYPRESFHTFNDAAEWNQMDKIGHFQSSYSIAQISTSLWDLSYMNHKRATWIGGLTSFGYLTTIEIMDGYSTGWGFSAADMIANTTGTALFISQELLWGSQKVMPKFGFSPSPYAEMRPNLLGSTFTEQVLKDYNGQTYWLSFNVASFLQSETKFPRWLNVAVGYGANGMTGGHENPVMYNSAGNEITVNRYRQYYLSLDIDLRRIPTRSRFLRVLFNTLNFIKIPAPAIEVNKFGVRGYVLKF